ncbi:MAG TPA: (deoxy)nucleoside triphosphate pyrophosphohydrolase [Salinivirgaceae bacterium]|nr:(deoxy)nucleoside triphosphate pyrophosphohydrolase [Salinivirgaceae bacterium]
MNPLSTPIDVTCAIIVKNRKILATRRKEHHKRGGLWEFPGGKIEPSETAQECIVREIEEELGLKIDIVGMLSPVVHNYDDIIIRLIPFIAITTTRIQFLSDHDFARFFSLDELQKLSWAEADRKILLQLTQSSLLQNMLIPR